MARLAILWLELSGPRLAFGLPLAFSLPSLLATLRFTGDLDTNSDLATMRRELDLRLSGSLASTPVLGSGRREQ